MKNLPLILLMLLAISCNNKKENILENGTPLQISSEKNHNTITENPGPSRATQNTLENENRKVSVALNFINDYVSHCNNRKEQIGVDEWVRTRTDVSEAFKTELSKMVDEAEKKNPDYGIGFDPIFDAQDYPPDGFELAEYNPNSNYLTVEAKTWEGFKITMKIKEVNNQWFVDGCGVINIPKERQAKR